MNKKLELTGEFILVKIADNNQNVGFIIPDKMKNNKIKKGKVILVSKGINANSKDQYNIYCKENDYILFFNYSGQEITLWKEKYILLKNSEIIGIINSDIDNIFDTN